MDGDGVVQESVHVVRVRKDQFDQLQSSVTLAFEDFQALAGLLGFDWQAALSENTDLTPHDLMVSALLPEVARLMTTQADVDEAKSQIREAAARFGNQTKDLGNGVKGLLVGRRVDGIFDGG